MPWTISCPRCQRGLTLPEEVIDQSVQCPACRCSFTVGRGSSSGPVVTSIAGIAVTPADLPKPRRPQENDSPRDLTRRRFADEDDDDTYPEDTFRYLHRDLPHRGSTVIILGTLSLALFCFFPISLALGIIAIKVANKDLASMAAGRMDREGESSTQIGRVLAVVGVVLGTLVMLSFCLRTFVQRF